MSKPSNNDRAVPTPLFEPDAHGQAAYLLVESLIHALVDKSIITRDTALELVEVACDVRSEIEYDLGDGPPALTPALMLLDDLFNTLSADRAR